MQKLKLPSTLTAIYHTAFKNCISIDTLTLPSKLSSIESSAFEGCNGIIDIKFSESLSKIEWSAFKNCRGIKKLIFPRKLQSIGSSAFQNCQSIATIVFPEDLITIENNAFDSCVSLQEVKIPSKLADLGSVFTNCIGLKNVILQTGLKRLNGYTFSGCTELTSITIPSGVTYISGGAFSHCTKLAEVNLPAGLQSMGTATFEECSSLKSITLPAGFTKLYGLTFQNCSSLTSVTLPVELSSMSSLEFDNCTQLTQIINLNPVPLANSSMVYAYRSIDQSKCKLIVQSSSVNTYKAADIWKNFIIQDGGYSVIASASNSMIGNVTGANRFYQPNEEATLEAVSKLGSAFINWTEDGTVISTSPVLKFQVSSNRKFVANFMREITVNSIQGGNLRDSIQDPNTISKLTVTGSIDARDIKFLRDNMTLLSSVDLKNAKIVAYSGSEGTVEGVYTYPENTMPSNAFMNNVNLKAIVLCNNLIKVDNQSFSGCPALLDCTLPESLTSIGSNAFSMCTNIKSIQLPLGLERIGFGAFGSCTGLSTINLPTHLKKIDTDAFAFCTGLTKIVVPGSLSIIDQFTFNQCSNIVSVEIQEGVSRISYSAFSGCKSIQNIILPSSISFIGTAAFYGCTGLKELTLPSGLSTLSPSAFYGCTKLTKITNPSSLPLVITSDVFSGVNQSICSLIVPVGTENQYRNAAIWQKFSISGSGYSISALSNNPLIGSISGLTSKLYQNNELISLTALPVDSVEFVNWTESGTEVSKSPNFSFNVNVNRKLIANFKRELNVKVVVSGSLINSIKNSESVTSLSLSGNIDARDVKMIRDNFLSLKYLDLKYSHIDSYNGSAGTDEFVKDYPENEIPFNSFNCSSKGFYNLLESIILPDDLDTIGQSAFYNCTKLKSVTMPPNLKSIESMAFSDCISLDTITLPAGLISMKYGSFSGCDKLKRITNESKQPILIDNRVFYNFPYNSCKLVVPDESIELYKAAIIWKDFYQIIGVSTNNQMSVEEVKVRIYPIPAKDVIFIDLSDSIHINSIEIYDVSGRLYWRSNIKVNQINISDLSKNTYIMKFNTSNEIIKRKFIKE